MLDINKSNDDDFLKKVTCNDFRKDCISRRFDDCRNLLEAFRPPLEGPILNKYQQLQTLHKKDEKITIIATVNVMLEDLRAQLNSFFIHIYITRMQAAHFAKLIAESNDFTITCRIDLSKNGALVQQDEIQSAHWTHT